MKLVARFGGIVAVVSPGCGRSGVLVRLIHKR